MTLFLRLTTSVTQFPFLHHIYFMIKIKHTSLFKTSVNQTNLRMHFDWMFCEKGGGIVQWISEQTVRSIRHTVSPGKKIPKSRCFCENIECHSLFVFLFGFICNDLSSKFWCEYAGQVSSWKQQTESLTTTAECALGSAAHAVPKST